MSSFSEHTQWQSDHYDIHHPLNPFESILRQHGYNLVFRPKDLRIKQAIETANLTKDTTVLDLGCASGLLLQRLHKTYSVSGIGIDVSPNLINKAKQLDPNNQYVYADASQLPFADNSFDLITSIDNLEHIKEYDKVIKEIARVLKPNGTVVIDTINRNNKYTIDWIFDLLGQDYHLKRAGHIRELFFDPEHIAELCKKNGLKNVQVHLYDATFTILTNSIFLVALILLEKIFIKTKYYSVTATRIIKITDWLSKFIAPIIDILDRPLVKRGYSNAFFIIATK